MDSSAGVIALCGMIELKKWASMRLMQLQKKHGLAVIEDDAQCFLGKYKGKTVGTLGGIASFSFQSFKHMTSGEGGMLVTQNEELAEKIRKYSCLGYAGLS